MPKRISNLRLGEIELSLSQADREILESLKRFHVLKTDQIRRMFFSSGHSSLQASKTKTLKVMRRFKTLGIADHFRQQYQRGCYGRQALIWHLTEAGYRLLDLGNPESKRKRMIEPSFTFLRHTIAVAECHLQIMDICKANQKLSIRCLDIEPDCWRTYQKDGKTISLRPDLYAETIYQEYRDRWFIEVDLDTEALSIVLEKCRRYQQYYLTNKEQTATGKFPVVMWIVPSERRKDNIITSIKEYFGNRYVHMFLVITPEQLKDVLVNGVKKEDLC